MPLSRKTRRLVATTPMADVLLYLHSSLRSSQQRKGDNLPIQEVLPVLGHQQHFYQEAGKMLVEHT